MKAYKNTKEDNLDKDIKEHIPNWTRSPQPDFVQLYLNDIGRLWKVSTKAQEVFGELMKLIEYSPKTLHNVVELNKRKRKIMMVNLNITSHQNPYVYLNRAIKELIEKGLIIQIRDDSTGEIVQDLYLIDPSICSKANWAHTELMQSIKLEITYSSSQRTLITFIEAQEPAYLEQQIDQLRYNQNR